MYGNVKKEPTEQSNGWSKSDKSDRSDRSSRTVTQRKSRHTKMNTQEVTYVNKTGDKYLKNNLGQITSYRYRHTNTTYSIGYGGDGSVERINSSDGWTWTKVQSSAFKGWVVHNYFDRWSVPQDESGAVTVDDTGVKATGPHAQMMGLPEQPN